MQADYILHQVRIRFKAEGQIAINSIKEFLPTVPTQSFEEPEVTFTLKSQEALLSLEQDGYVALTGREPRTTLEFLRERLHDHLARNAKGHLILRAGVVTWGGTALLLAGPRLSGMSTLIEALSSRGAVRYSDQLAIFDESLQVIPYQGDPKAQQDAAPCPIGLIATLPYLPDTPAEHSHQSGGQATMALLPLATVLEQSQTPTVLATLAGICRKARFLKGTRLEAGACAEAILQEMAQLAPTPEGV